ncbi:phosphate acyltransferase PlsX [Lactococcus termiticola]|uniref:Phosphate acyltransferase n=1 Tax=Lactococcus termiticola TaxID=2169526 RepID=A0A2R5HG75_9LACT|nr:phosphate acyltransferase PlsX [Lactococcus termiticola]GBG96856.1 phosphate acyltransferase [Lactococcus termiticola]
MKIAVDAMGGDYAPEAIVKGVELARASFPDIEFLLFGDPEAIKKHLSDEKNISIIKTTELIDFHDEPLKAIRKKKDSSLVRAVKAVKDGEAQAVLSAGSTGALLAAGLFIVGRIKQIERPALMNTLPTADGLGFDMMDLGANAENKAEHLLDFAILGSYYAENVRNINKPRVALLSNGAEESKGSPLVKEAHELLSNEVSINFVGNIESRDILAGGMADVVVTDGFTGNAVLKAIEGTASVLMKQIKDGIMNGGLGTKIGGALVKKELSKLRNTMSTDSAGGAPIFGLKAPVVKTHGNSSPEAIFSTIKQIHKMLETDVVGKLVEHFEKNAEEKH